jgi:hypothetical protein
LERLNDEKVEREGISKSLKITYDPMDIMKFIKRNEKLVKSRSKGINVKNPYLD